YASRHHDFLCRRESHDIGDVQQRHIEKHVVPLASNVQTRCLPLADQLRQPGVVDVASQIPSFDALVPQARHNHQSRHRQHTPAIGAEKCPSACYHTTAVSWFIFHSILLVLKELNPRHSTISRWGPCPSSSLRSTILALLFDSH